MEPLQSVSKPLHSKLARARTTEKQATMAAYGATNLTVETRSPPRDQQKRPSITTHSPGATTIVYDEEAAPPPSPTDAAEARVMRRSLEANVVLTVAKVAVAFHAGPHREVSCALTDARGARSAQHSAAESVRPGG